VLFRKKLSPRLPAASTEVRRPPVGRPGHAVAGMAVLALVLALFAGPAAAAAAPGASLCLMEPWARISLRSPITATIATVLVDRGAVVRKGQPLVQLESSVELAAMAGARYRAVMEGTVKSAEARLTHARLKLQRRDELRQQNYVSAQDRDDAEAEMRIATADLVEATDNREMARLDLLRLTAEVNRRTITSPINGVVTERLQQPGELAQSGDTGVAVLKLAQTDPVRVEVVLPAARFGKTRVGDIVTIKPEPPFAGSYKAVVRVVDPVIDSGSGTFGIRLEIPNPKGAVLTGVKCSAEL
jgi:RND family efflux transporter MFP subunit